MCKFFKILKSNFPIFTVKYIIGELSNVVFLYVLSPYIIKKCLLISKYNNTDVVV